jgi:enoyl-CoA hydratase/carnithine racemase
VNGTAAGAGIGLKAMADLAYCGSSSKFKLACGGVGLTPDAGASEHLVQDTEQLLSRIDSACPAS